MRPLLAAAAAALLQVACSKPSPDPAVPTTTASASADAVTTAPTPSPEDEREAKILRAKDKRAECKAIAGVLVEHQERERIVNSADPKTLVMFADELDLTAKAMQAAKATETDLGQARGEHGALLGGMAKTARDASRAKTSKEVQQNIAAIRADAAHENGLIQAIQEVCNRPIE